MIKYESVYETFEEIPTEINLCINITNCPIHCEGCHSKYLWKDIGDPLTTDVLDGWLQRHSGITCVVFMGGDSDPESINQLASYVRTNHSNIKTAWYTGRDNISDKIKISNFDYIKTGPYIQSLGGLDKKTTNQRMWKVVSNDEMIDITSSFWISDRIEEIKER